MIEVHPGLYVGDDSDVLEAQGEDWFIVHAAKEPYHRAALGYKAAGAPKGHPERLVAFRDGCVILNLIDAPTADMIPGEVIRTAVDAIHHNLGRKNVLVHCNKGQSRSPTIALLYLALHTEQFDDCDYDEAAHRFRATYPSFQPAAGMEGFARSMWTREGSPWPDPEREQPDTEPDIEPDPIPSGSTDWPPKARQIFTF